MSGFRPSVIASVVLGLMTRMAMAAGAASPTISLIGVAWYLPLWIFQHKKFGVLSVYGFSML